jgi:2-polyprenyl-6-methoxyphenol hydroxylase-like FAD-dependent oxidoreductase
MNTNVVVVGAGAAGLTAGFELALEGTYNFKLLEASSGM